MTARRSLRLGPSRNKTLTLSCAIAADSMLEKVLEKLGTTESTTLNVKREDGEGISQAAKLGPPSPVDRRH
jgi:hypothetical protein